MTARSQPLAAAFLVAAYTAVFRSYGIFDVSDEGNVAMQAWRVAHGERPFLDFHTGYGPLHFAAHGVLFGWGGLLGLRWGLVLVHATSAGIMVAWTRRLAGPVAAWIALALQVAFFLPVSREQGAPFLVGYPGWVSTLAYLVAGLALLEAPVAPRLLALGVLVGWTTAIKLNGGVLLGAAIAVVAAVRTSGRGSAAWRGVVALAAAALVWGVVAGDGLQLLFFGMFSGAVLLALGQGGRRGFSWPNALLLLAGALGAILPFWWPLLQSLGVERFGREVLLIGAGVAEVYRLAPPWTLAAGSLLGLAVVLAPQTRVVGAVIAGLAGVSLCLALLTGGVSGARVELEDLALLGGMLAPAVALRLVRTGDDRYVAVAALCAAALAQLHPRPDFVHLAGVSPVLLPALVVGWMRFTVPVLGAAAAVALPLVAASVRGASAIALAASILTGDVTQVSVGDTMLMSSRPTTLNALATAVDAVRSRVPPGESVITFPACGLVPALADRATAGPFDYFFPGRPTRQQTAALVEHWQLAPPPAAVTCTAAGSDLAGAWHEHPELGAFLAGRYRPVVVASPFTILERRP